MLARNGKPSPASGRCKTKSVGEIASLLQLADMPAELPAEIRNMLRQLYRLPARERSFILQFVTQLLDLLEERLGYPSVLPPTAADRS
jgi:hypothetical protein